MVFYDIWYAKTPWHTREPGGLCCGALYCTATVGNIMWCVQASCNGCQCLLVFLQPRRKGTRDMITMMHMMMSLMTTQVKYCLLLPNGDCTFILFYGWLGAMTWTARVWSHYYWDCKGSVCWQLTAVRASTVSRKMLVSYSQDTGCRSMSSTTSLHAENNCDASFCQLCGVFFVYMWYPLLCSVICLDGNCFTFHMLLPPIHFRLGSATGFSPKSPHKRSHSALLDRLFGKGLTSEAVCLDMLSVEFTGM